MILQLGDKGLEVAELQKLLSMIGYDLVIDGDFGPKTKRSVKAFQKKMGLLNDGTVDSSTMEALKLAQPKKAKEQSGSSSSSGRYPFEVIDSHRLKPEQYIRQTQKKSQIFLHYTASGPSARGVIDYWNSDEPRIATAFVIDGYKGEIYECFNPDFWSYHLGVKGTKGALDKASIGIEICAYGPLVERNGQFYAWPNNFSTVKIPENKVYKLTRQFRGYNLFEALTDEQIASLEKLLEFLIPVYNIDIQSEFDYTWFDFNDQVIRDRIPGIWSHTTVRKDKYDLYPDHRIIDMLNRLSRKFYKG